jgi:hypothetical protein
MKENNYKLLSGILALVLAGPNAFAGAPTVVNSTWVGDGSPNFFNGEWSNATLWDPDGVPNDAGGTVYDVTIPYDEDGFLFNGPTLDVNVTIQNLTLVSRAVVDNQINNGTNLTVTGSTTFSTSPGGDFGVITAAGNSTFNLGTLTNYNAATKTLEGARFSAYLGATIAFRGADVVTNNGELLVGGTGSRIINQDTGANAFANIEVNNFSFSIENDLSFTTAGNFTNNASLSVRSGTNVTSLTISGSLTNYNAATFTLSGGSFYLDGPGTATLRFPNADIRVISDAFVTVDGAGASITDLLGNDALRNLSSVSGALTLGGTRTLTPMGGNFQVTGNFTVANNSSVTVQGNYTQNSGQLTVNNDSDINATGTLFASQTIVALGTTFGSPLATTASAGSGFTVSNFSQLTGTGTAFGDLTFTADSSFIPGFSAGQVNVEGNLTMDSSCSFVMEVGGLLPGEEFDLIAQTGAFTIDLGGSTLLLSLINGFENNITDTDSFDIITSENPIAGSFGNVAHGDRLSTSDGLGNFRVTYAGQDKVTLDDFQAGPLALEVTAAVSRKMHGALGPFDIPLPLASTPGVECRSSGGNHTLVFTFTNDVVSGSASVATETGGDVAGSPTFAGNSMTVNLTGVTDVQQIAVTLSNVTDSFSQVLPDTAVTMNMLIGDTNGSSTVNSTDIGQTKTQSGVPVTTANFRRDVTPNGTINSSDIGVVKSRSGASISPPAR